ncbi:MAG TPA: hypothetical protein QGF58_12155 [Myxococcota bacterium]|nr:hypothetical protein [Myxococcota bacterium]
MTFQNLKANGLTGDTIFATASSGVYALSVSVEASEITSSGPIRAKGSNGSGTFDLRVINTTFDANQSVGTAPDIDVDGLDSLTVKGCNFGNSSSEEASGSIRAVSTSTTITTSTWNSNIGRKGGALAFEWNVTFANTGGVGISGEANAVDEDYTLWNNDNSDSLAVGAGDIQGEDPKFDEGFDPFSCTFPPGLQETSPAINRGDPATTNNDPDGSRNDMGAFGGPDANPTGVPWSRGADISKPHDTGEPDESDPPDDSGPDDSDLEDDTGLPERPELVTWMSGGCGAAGALVTVLGLLLVRRR